jgi:hypothetical protein
MIRLDIDGTSHTGNYRVDCECRTSWHGQGEPIGSVNWSPAAPIAECIVHLKLCHNADRGDMWFSDRFRLWLIHYWEREALRLQARGQEPAYGITQRG